MKVYLIKASAPGPFKEYKKSMGAPPQNIFAVAACTPKGVQIDMCDETVDMKPRLSTDADVVALFFHTPDAVHAYALADAFRERGRIVVLGGLHPSFMPDEAQKHADALIIGEVEGVWAKLLADVKAGALKRRYQRTSPLDMADLKPYPTNIIRPSQYNGVWSVMVSRGCVHRCEYCVVPPFFNAKYRVRPVENIVAEIKAAPATWFELHADNLTADREYAIKLFKALKQLDINWMGESTIKMAEDEELLRLAGESGCKYLLVGIETPSQAALKTSGKGFVTPEDVRDRIRRFHDHGISITSSMIFGFDTHTADIFRESLDFCRQIEIDEVESVILCPFPGTPLYERMENEGRILTRDWSKYDCSNVVFQPKNMTPEELSEGAAWFWTERAKKKSSGEDRGKVNGSGRSGGFGRSVGRAGNIRKIPSVSRFKWKSLLALGIVGAALYTGQYWLWGVLFMWWAVNDLRKRHTYLMDDIPRSENPILYWIIVLMWLALSLWSVSTAPLFDAVWDKWSFHAGPTSMAVSSAPEGAGVSQLKSEAVPPPAEQTEPFPESNLRPVKVPSAKRKARASGQTKTLRESAFGLSMDVPAGWRVVHQPIDGGRMLDAEAPERRATLSCLGLELGGQYSSDKLLSMMEDALIPDMPFMVSAEGRQSSITAPESRTRMAFRRYVGALDGEPITVVIGFGVDKTRGYAVVGVYGSDDTAMKEAVRKSLATFRVDR